jgi:hypothetical protein
LALLLLLLLLCLCAAHTYHTLQPCCCCACAHLTSAKILASLAPLCSRLLLQSSQLAQKLLTCFLQQPLMFLHGYGFGAIQLL